MIYSSTLDPKSRDLLNSWEAQKQGRLGREAVWQEVSDYCESGESFVDDQGNTLLRGGPVTTRQVFTGVGILNSTRLPALLLAYLVNFVRPFLDASLESPPDLSGGFVMQNAMSGSAQAYLAGMGWAYHAEQMRTKSNFLTATVKALRDFVNYGPGIKFSTLNSRGEARFRQFSVKNCWIDVNEDGEVDTLFRRSYYRLDRLIEAFPAAQGCKGISNLLDKMKTDADRCRVLIEVNHAVRPRAGGVKYGVSYNMPFASIFWLPKYDGYILKEEGFNTFPYSVARNNPTEDNPYGVGISEQALPDLKSLNHYHASIENNLDLINEPPLLYMNGIFDKVSFDAGAITGIDPFAAGMSSLRDAVMPLNVPGNVSPAMSYVDRMELRIGEFYFTDWMKLRENGNMTATEVNERRDLRIRSMSSLVPGLDRDMFGNEADRIMELKQKRRLLPPPPPELIGKFISWDYSGPLADAFRANQADVLSKVFSLWQALSEQAPEIADIIDIDSLIRTWADALGLEPGVLRSKAEAAARMQQRQQQQQSEQAQQALISGATALRDSSQGIANLANAGNTQAIAAANDMAA